MLLSFFILELFLNKREPSSTAQHRPQWHHPQNALCGCGSDAPKCCSASYHQWHARQRYGFGSRLYSPPFAQCFMLVAGSFDSYAASYKECQADPAGNPIAYPDNPNQLEHAGRSTNPSLGGTLVSTSCHHDDGHERSDREKRCTCLGGTSPCSSAYALFFPL